MKKNDIAANNGEQDIKTGANQPNSGNPNNPVVAADNTDVAGAGNATSEASAANNSGANENAQNGKGKGAPKGEDVKAPSKDEKKDKVGAPNAKASVQRQKIVDSAKIVVEMMDSNKVDVLFENTKGEFFTSANIAYLSEKGAKDSIKTHRRESLELLIKSVE